MIIMRIIDLMIMIRMLLDSDDDYYNDCNHNDNDINENDDCNHNDNDINENDGNDKW